MSIGGMVKGKGCFGILVAIASREAVVFFRMKETLHISSAVDRGWTLIV